MQQPVSSHERRQTAGYCSNEGPRSRTGLHDTSQTAALSADNRHFPTCNMSGLVVGVAIPEQPHDVSPGAWRGPVSFDSHGSSWLSHIASEEPTASAASLSRSLNLIEEPDAEQSATSYQGTPPTSYPDLDMGRRHPTLKRKTLELEEKETLVFSAKGQCTMQEPWQQDTFILAPGSVYCLEFSRTPRSFHEALDKCAALRCCRNDLKSENLSCNLDSGTRLYVPPSLHSGVLRAIAGWNLQSRHIVASSSFVDSITESIATIVGSEQVHEKRNKRRCINFDQDADVMQREMHPHKADSSSLGNTSKLGHLFCEGVNDVTSQDEPVPPLNVAAELGLSPDMAMLNISDTTATKFRRQGNYKETGKPLFGSPFSVTSFDKWTNSARLELATSPFLRQPGRHMISNDDAYGNSQRRARRTGRQMMKTHRTTNDGNHQLCQCPNVCRTIVNHLDLYCQQCLERTPIHGVCPCVFASSNSCCGYWDHDDAFTQPSEFLRSLLKANTADPLYPEVMNALTQKALAYVVENPMRLEESWQKLLLAAVRHLDLSTSKHFAGGIIMEANAINDEVPIIFMYTERKEGNGRGYKLTGAASFPRWAYSTTHSEESTAPTSVLHPNFFSALEHFLTDELRVYNRKYAKAISDKGDEASITLMCTENR